MRFSLNRPYPVELLLRSVGVRLVVDKPIGRGGGWIPVGDAERARPGVAVELRLAQRFPASASIDVKLNRRVVVLPERPRQRGELHHVPFPGSRITDRVHRPQDRSEGVLGGHAERIPGNHPITKSIAPSAIPRQTGIVVVDQGNIPPQAVSRYPMLELGDGGLVCSEQCQLQFDLLSAGSTGQTQAEVRRVEAGGQFRPLVREQQSLRGYPGVDPAASETVAAILVEVAGDPDPKAGAPVDPAHAGLRDLDRHLKSCWGVRELMRQQMDTPIPPAAMAFRSPVTDLPIFHRVGPVPRP